MCVRRADDDEIGGTATSANAPDITTRLRNKIIVSSLLTTKTNNDEETLVCKDVSQPRVEKESNPPEDKIWEANASFGGCSEPCARRQLLEFASHADSRTGMRSWAGKTELRMLSVRFRQMSRRKVSKSYVRRVSGWTRSVVGSVLSRNTSRVKNGLGRASKVRLAGRPVRRILVLIFIVFSFFDAAEREFNGALGVPERQERGKTNWARVRKTGREIVLGRHVGARQ